MSRRGNRIERRRRSKQRKEQRFEEMLRNTAEVFTCSTEITRDFADQCDDSQQNLQADIAFNALALEIWQGRAGRAEDLARLLADLLAERRRYFAALGEFVQRFRQLSADESFHTHLDDAGIDADFVRRRVFPDPDTEQPEPSPAA